MSTTRLSNTCKNQAQKLVGWQSKPKYSTVCQNGQSLYLSCSKSIAIKDACLAVKAAKQGFSKDGLIRKGKFRSRKDTKQSIYVPKTAIKDCGVYHSILGKCRIKEALPATFSDGRLTLAYGEYYLIVSEEVQQVKTDKQGRLVALDPGVRTFMTFFSEDSYG